MRWGKITSRLGDNGYYYLTMSGQHRYLAAGAANTALANAGWPREGSEKRRLLWRYATPYTPKSNPSRGAKSLTLRNMALVTIKRLPGGAVAVSGRKMAGGGGRHRANPGGRRQYAIVKESGEPVDWFPTKKGADESLIYWTRRLDLPLAIRSYSARELEYDGSMKLGPGRAARGPSGKFQKW